MYTLQDEVSNVPTCTVTLACTMLPQPLHNRKHDTKAVTTYHLVRPLACRITITACPGDNDGRLTRTMRLYGPRAFLDHLTPPALGHQETKKLVCWHALAAQSA